jgi:DNA methyltransferase 1-associated protein 1
MATAKDVKDMLGLSGGDGAPKPAAAKKAKVPGQKRLSTFKNFIFPLIRGLIVHVAGINREVLALHGDRAPPVSIIDSTKTFRGKLKRDFRPSKW